MNHALVAFALSVLPGVAGAQDKSFMDLTMPDLSAAAPATAPYGCPPHEKPEWTNAIKGREIYRTMLLMAIYDAGRVRAVEAAGTCSCEAAVPSWDEADGIYQTYLAPLESGTQIKLRLELNAELRLREHAVHKLCKKELG